MKKLVMFSLWTILYLIVSCKQSPEEKTAKQLVVPFAKLKHEGNSLGSLVKVITQKSDTSILVDLKDKGITPDSLMKYIWYPVSSKFTSKNSLFYNQILYTKPIDSLLKQQPNSSTNLSTEEFLKIVSLLDKMQRSGDKKFIPNSQNLRERGIQIYKLTGQIPVAIVDVDLEIIEKINGNSLGLNQLGQLAPSGKVDISRKSILIAAPLVSVAHSSQVKIVFRKELVITNKKSNYKVLLDNGASEPMSFEKPIKIASKDGAIVFGIKSENGSVSVSGIKVVSPGILPSRRFGYLRALSGESISQSFALVGTSLGPEMDPPNMTWKPGSLGCGSEYAGRFATLESVSEAAGYEMGMWLSDINRGRPESEIQIEPLIILGGQDWETNDPQSLFNAFQARMGNTVIAQLLTRFDLFTFSYWTGGAIETIGEARDRGIRRSIQDNAILLADAIRFIYCELNIKKKAVFIGISMGGNVSRLAFLGIENGPIIDPSAGEIYRGIPNFPAKTVPVRLWITIDAPHRGATIPIGFQDWVESFDFLPNLESDIELLDAPSTMELLTPHRIGSPSSTDYPNSKRRIDLIKKQNEWGGFPSTIGCSIAVSSGDFNDMNRTNLWQTNSENKIDVYADLIDGFLEETTKRAVYGCEPITIEIPFFDDIKYFSFNRWEFRTNLSSVMTPTTLALKSYRPLGPSSLPLLYSSANFKIVKNSFADLSFSLTSTMSQQTYKKNTFSEVVGDEYCDRIGSRMDILGNRYTTDELGSIRKYTAYVEANLHGEFNITLDNLPDFLDPIPIDFSVDFKKEHRFAFKPYGLEVGGYRDTGKQIDDKLKDAIGSEYRSSLFLPNHCFVPTISALDFSDSFLNAAFRKFADSHPSGFGSNSYLYERGKSPGFKPDQFLEYLHVREALSLGTSNVKKISNITINFGGGVNWTGSPTPFSYIVFQDGSLPHTMFSDESKTFIVESIFRNECAISATNIPSFKIETLEWLKDMERIPLILGQLPPGPCFDPLCVSNFKVEYIKKRLGLN